ncbi:tripartite tricarboxylate transporter permease, partial [Deinococcus sp.]|uniref:tripartite tricarboxylate transporter permease n=1 Tax=Deinococcus sp. TaxID=47478 RepID=UPI0039190C45
LIASLYIGNVMLLALNLPLAPVWARLLLIPRPFLYAGILVFSTVGVYSLNNSVFDLILLAIFGVIGYGMRRFDFPVTPAIIGVILGPVAESQFRTALQQSNGNPAIFVQSPLTVFILLTVLAALIVPAVLKARASRRG